MYSCYILLLFLLLLLPPLLLFLLLLLLLLCFSSASCVFSLLLELWIPRRVDEATTGVEKSHVFLLSCQTSARDKFVKYIYTYIYIYVADGR